MRLRVAIRHPVVLALLAAFVPLGALIAKDDPPSDGPIVESLIVEPASVVLHGSNRQQQFVVTGTTRSGQPLDITRLCRFDSSDTKIVRAAEGLARGEHDGTAKVRVSYGKLTANVSVKVEGFANYPPVHFANDLVPLFSKHGCNSGGCHGKASGQNGFRLSVFGFDPPADFDALLKEARGRRVFAASPENSLLMLKATGRVAHGGGRRIAADSLDAEVIRQWLLQGMPIGRPGTPTAVSIQVSPSERVLGLKSQQQILTTAVYSDGSLRDVTAATGYSSNASQVAEVDSRGLVRTGAVPGEAAITVHYMGHVGAVRLQVPRPDAPNPYPTLPTSREPPSLNFPCFLLQIVANCCAHPFWHRGC